MKIVIFVLLLSTFTLSTPNCASTSYCQACNTVTTTDCDFCYSWKTNAKAGASSSAVTCTDSMPTEFHVTDCMIYNTYGPTNAYTGMGTVGLPAATLPRCLQCDGKNFLDINQGSNTQVCVDTATNTYSTPECALISNC